MISFHNTFLSVSMRFELLSFELLSFELLNTEFPLQSALLSGFIAHEFARL